MFNVPYRFRRQTEFCTPKGPDINWAPYLYFSINGTEIKLKMPKHKINSPMDSLNPKRRYTLNPRDFSKQRPDKVGWESQVLITRGWDFNGSWFIGARALMQMHASIITPAEVNNNVSFFHPRAFEAGIAEYMTYHYGDQISVEAGTQDWFAPMNWQPLINYPCIAVCCDALENRNVASDRMNRYLFFPLSDQHILKIEFPISRNLCYIYSDTKPEDDKDKWINNAPMEQLATDIINSLQITLSPEAKQQQEKALAGLADKSLVKEFAPIKWV